MTRSGTKVDSLVVLSDSVSLYCGDCRDILPTLGKVDAVVTDPPYGIAKERHRAGEPCGRGCAPKRRWVMELNEWDLERPQQETFDTILGMATQVVLWGGNYFADMLPPSMGWLYWDKANDGKSFGNGELAWTSRWGALRTCRLMWDGMLRASKDGALVHPTQKPTELMVWAMAETKIPDTATVCDPFMGSGSTGVACIRTGRRFIGIERDAGHFETARARLENELRQGLLPLTYN